MTEHQIAARSTAAESVLGNEAYKAAMDGLKAQIVQQWKDCPVRDKEGALLLLQLATLCDKFEGILSGMIEAGKMAQMRIDLDAERDENKLKKLARKIGR